MPYNRVVPRDLFNEASLLKCYGRLCILLDNLPRSSHRARLSEGDGSEFEVCQDDGDGSLTVSNLPFTIARRPFRLCRPLNSRRPWPLYVIDGDGEETEVFTDEGELTADFAHLIKGG